MKRAHTTLPPSCSTLFNLYPHRFYKMGNLSKKRARQRRRDQFFSLHAVHNGEGDIAELVNEARRRSRTAVSKAHRDVQANNVTKIATKTADDVTELYLTNLPTGIIATELVKALHSILYSRDVIPMEYVLRVSYTSDPFPESPVLRCEIRLPKDLERRPVAYVSVRNASIAEHLLECSPLEVNSISVPIVLCKRPVVPGVGSAWRSRRDPGSISWKVGMVQFGEKIADDLFSTFWASSEFFDLSVNCHLELKPVERILAITIGSPQRLWKSQSLFEDFKETESILRIEIHFRSICGAPFVERNPDSKQDCAVYFPISRPPLLFRVEDNSFVADPDVQRSLLWDCSQDAFESVRWIRTVDPSEHGAFSRARGFRIMLGTNDMNALFARLHRMCIVDTPSPFPVSGSHEIEMHHPDRHRIFQRASKTFKVPFRLAYMVECILSLGNTSLTRITDEFWRTLMNGIFEKDALPALNLMYFRLSELEMMFRRDGVSSLVNDPVSILQECMDMCNVSRITSGTQGMSVVEDIQGDTLDESEDIDKPTADEVFQRLSSNEIDIAESGLLSEDILPGDIEGSSTVLRLPSRQHALIRRLLFTPTRVIAQPPETDLLNRVLREFAVHHDRFLRISFCDEDGGSIGHTGSDDLYTRVRLALRNGVSIAGENFVFLAFSNSQLRDHAVWMYNEARGTITEGPIPPTADEIRAWMGDFSKIRVPGK